MILSMDEIINAVCLHQAERRGVKPTDVSLELSWDEETGYTAEVWVNGRTQYFPCHISSHYHQSASA